MREFVLDFRYTAAIRLTVTQNNGVKNVSKTGLSDPEKLGRNQRKNSTAAKEKAFNYRWVA